MSISFHCLGCHEAFNRDELFPVYDDQGIYVGLFHSDECAELNSPIRLHRTNEEAYTAGDWGDDDY